VARALIEREELVVGVLSLIESDGEMDEVEVKVVEAELRKAVIQRVGNVLGAVLGVPKLRCDENILSLQVRDLAAECLLERLSDLLLVSVTRFTVISLSLKHNIRGIGRNCDPARRPSTKPRHRYQGCTYTLAKSCLQR
jgi:hypothetical protein